jgi:hypothetical protein
MDSTLNISSLRGANQLAWFFLLLLDQQLPWLDLNGSTPFAGQYKNIPNSGPSVEINLNES